MKGLHQNQVIQTNEIERKRLKNEVIEDFTDKEYAHAFINSFLNTYIATQIKVLRQERGWTQKDLANKTDMKQPRISVMENVYYDNWSISTLNKLAEAFDVTLNVSFETFSDRIDDIFRLNHESLKRKPREDVLTADEVSTEFDTLPSKVIRIADYDGIKVKNEDAISRGSKPTSDLYVEPDQERAIIG